MDLKGNRALKLALAESLLDKIVEKTQDNKSLKGTPFKKYSKRYKNSEDFKAFGKTDKVNLTLTGDMLGLLDVSKETDNTVELSWEQDDEAAKAHGHIVGNPKTNLPKRDFFGLNNKDIEQVKNKFSEELASIKNLRDSERDRAILAFIDRLDDDAES